MIAPYSMWNIYYCVISSAVQNVIEGHTVIGVGQAVLSDPIKAAFGCDTYHRAQSIKLDL